MRILVPVMFIAFLIMVIFFMNPRVAASEGQAPTKARMQEVLTHLEALKPFMASEEKFVDPKNDMEIRDQLKALSQAIRAAGHDPQLKKPVYKFSRDVLENHLYETERVFRLGNKPYARWMLNSSMSLCMSCHTQIPTGSRMLTAFESPKTFTSDFEQAEFLFTTRVFDKASKIYDGLIENYPGNKIKSDQLETSLERQVAYFVRIQRDPAEGLKIFQKYQAKKDLPVYLTKDIAAWVALFEEWSKQPKIDPRTATDDEILAFIKKTTKNESWDKMTEADNPRYVTNLRLSGVLYEFLQTHPNSKIVPDVLYWLAICDRRTSNNFFFSLADVYLKECIMKYPKSKIAKDCFKEYEDEIIMSFSGSGGVHVPEDVTKELEKLKKFVEQQ